ncbi:MAG: flap endonuclease-1 [Candidatus Heimdallarchaeota archaeon]|nr:flap endonuclease-1 [Candidatus Heimdallarchaeota archaeon]
MGVTKLGDLFPQRDEITFDDLHEKAIAFDGNNILYQFLTRIRQSDGSLLTDENGNVTSHLSGLLYRLTRIVEKGIKAVFIFDGQPPEEKMKELVRRKKVKKEAEIAYVEALERGDMELAQRYAQRTARLTSPMIEDAMKFLKFMGIPVIQAPMEGEGQAAFMAKKGDVWASCSQDYDSLLFGAPKLVRNLTVSGKRKLPRKNVYIEVKPELIDLAQSLKALEITREQLVDLAILLGTDFNPDGIGVSGIGPKTALKLIKEHQTIEKILELPSMSAAQKDLDFQTIRDLFLKPKVLTDYTLEWHSPDIEGIVDFLCGQRGFSETRVRNALEKTLKTIEERKQQPTLDAFFSSKN